MAMDFSLEIETSMKPEQVADLILNIEGFEKDTENNSYFSAEGLSGGVRSLDEISQEVLQEEVGILANVRIWYRLDHSEYEKGMRNGLRTFTTILERTKGDAVVRLNGDDIKLLRKDGKLTLNSESFSNENNAVWRYIDIPFPEYEVKKLKTGM